MSYTNATSTELDEQILRLSPAWELRRNGSRAVLLDRDPHTTSYLILDQAEVVVIALFDGRRTVAEVVRDISYVLDLSPDRARNLVERTVRSVNRGKAERLLPPRGAEQPAVQSPPVEDLLGPPCALAHPRRLEVPVSLGITLTHRCQTQCLYCYAERRHVHRADELTVAAWYDLIDQAADLGIDRIALLGGDPLARTEALSILEHMVQRGFWFFLSTKCHVDRATARRLADIGLGERQVQVSLDAPVADVADFLTGSPGFYRLAMDSLRNLLDCGLAVRPKAVLTSYNARRAPELVRMWYDMGVREMQLIDYSRSHYHHSDDLFVGAADSAWVAEQVEELRGVLIGAEIVYGAQARDAGKAETGEVSAARDWEAWNGRARCSAGSSSLMAAPDGLVFLCEQIPQIPEHFVGDLRRQTIMEVWNSERLLAYIFPDREQLIGSPCYECARFDDCHRASGHCFRDALFAFGSRYMPPPSCPKAPAGAPRLY